MRTLRQILDDLKEHLTIPWVLEKELDEKCDTEEELFRYLREIQEESKHQHQNYIN